MSKIAELAFYGFVLFLMVFAVLAWFTPLP